MLKNGKKNKNNDERYVLFLEKYIWIYLLPSFTYLKRGPFNCGGLRSVCIVAEQELYDVFTEIVY